MQQDGGEGALFRMGKSTTMAVAFKARQACVTWEASSCNRCPARMVALVHSPTRLGSFPKVYAPYIFPYTLDYVASMA
jgi:hypothetical protein